MRCNNTLKEVLESMLDYEMQLEHVRGHVVRREILKTIISKIGIDPKFDGLLELQLMLFVDRWADPRDFVAVVNNPRHVIRQALLSWSIDHP
jgi:hypothetical protein